MTVAVAQVTAVRVEVVVTELLPTLEAIGSFLVLGQGFTTVLAVIQILKDKRVAGMSVWTMGFYAFASWYYVPIFYLSNLIWTTIAVGILGALETAWVILAIVYRRRVDQNPVL